VLIFRSVRNFWDRNFDDILVYTTGGQSIPLLKSDSICQSYAQMNKNLAIANGSRVNCAHNTSWASICLITHDLGQGQGQRSLKITGNRTIG